MLRSRCRLCLLQESTGGIHVLRAGVLYRFVLSFLLWPLLELCSAGNGYHGLFAMFRFDSWDSCPALFFFTTKVVSGGTVRVSYSSWEPAR